jgi:hypothetical protein
MSVSGVRVRRWPTRRVRLWSSMTTPPATNHRAPPQNQTKMKRRTAAIPIRCGPVIRAIAHSQTQNTVPTTSATIHHLRIRCGRRTVSLNRMEDREPELVTYRVCPLRRLVSLPTSVEAGLPLPRLIPLLRSKRLLERFGAGAKISVVKWIRNADHGPVWTGSPWSPPRESIERRGRHAWYWIVFWIAGILAFILLCGIGIASCMRSLSSLGNFGATPTVKPISIPATSCPYLRVLNAVEESAGAGWINALDYNTTDQWRPFAAQLAPKLAVLETTLLVASAHVPRPVASDFADALHQVVLGRPALAASLTVNDYLSQTNDAVEAGWSDLNDAGGLIGLACGFVFSPLPDE